MPAKAKCDAVLMIGFGGPTRADEVRPFLDNVLRGRPIPRERYEEVVHHYDLLGGPLALQRSHDATGCGPAR